MIRKKILYIGTPCTYKLYREGKNPSHWLYGAVEMEKSGHEVIWEHEDYSLFHDISLYVKHRPDIIFIPNLNLRAHFFLLICSAWKFIRVPIFSFLHHSPIRHRDVNKVFIKMLFKGISRCFFLSELTMKETVESGFVSNERSSYIKWYPDMEFYKKYENLQAGNSYVSTGKENRDFELLLRVFKNTGANLKILTCKRHGNREYLDLDKRVKSLSNVELSIVENSGAVYPELVEAMQRAKCLVCPLISDSISYCVGLSTILDAEALGKPLIITKNPYHDKSRLINYSVVENDSDWERAIREDIINVKVKQVSDIWQTYKEMRVYMGL